MSWAGSSSADRFCCTWSILVRQQLGVLAPLTRFDWPGPANRIKLIIWLFGSHVDDSVWWIEWLITRVLANFSGKKLPVAMKPFLGGRGTSDAVAIKRITKWASAHTSDTSWRGQLLMRFSSSHDPSHSTLLFRGNFATDERGNFARLWPSQLERVEWRPKKKTLRGVLQFLKNPKYPKKIQKIKFLHPYFGVKKFSNSLFTSVFIYKIVVHPKKISKIPKQIQGFF